MLKMHVHVALSVYESPLHPFSCVDTVRVRRASEMTPIIDSLTRARTSILPTFVRQERPEGFSLHVYSPVVLGAAHRRLEQQPQPKRRF